MLPTDMIAIEIARPGGPEQLMPVRRPVPRPGPGEVLIKVAAAGVNRPDLLQREGFYPPPPGASDIPGLEVAGTVVAVGDGVAHPRSGQAVTALLTGGGYAEYAVAAAPLCLPVPDGLDLAAAAALPETVFTVWHNVFQRGRLVAGETLLVHGGTSGIGTIAIMLAKSQGARVFATAGSPAKVAAIQALGADLAIDYRATDFVAAAMQASDGRGVDIVLDMVGGPYVARNLDCLAMDGRHVSIAFLQGSRVSLDLALVMKKRLTLTGSTLRPRSVAEKADIAAEILTRVWPLMGPGQIAPIIHARLPLAEAARAHALMESGVHVGKIVLLV